MVGAWNLEHFSLGAQRGFPEDQRGGPSYPPRSAADFRQIARLIERELGASLMLLTEVDGVSLTRSPELDRLVEALGPDWDYRLTESGGHQHIAALFDRRALRLSKCVELNFAEEKLDQKDIFTRNPLACFFGFHDPRGRSLSDFIVVGVHLASGQNRVKNHNRAMSILVERLHESLRNGTFPSGERDLLIGGDFNASRYDRYRERFWDDFDPDGFRLVALAPSAKAEYPATRLGGVPLRPSSQIDYFLASSNRGGALGMLVSPIAQVHTSTLSSLGAEGFRRSLSDHLPVTIRLQVLPDDD